MFKTTILTCLLAATAANVLPAQGPTDPKLQRFVIEPGAIEMSELVDRSASYLGWNILVNQQELAHCADQFKLQNRIETDRSGCEDVLTTMLATRGIVVRPLDEGKKLYEVVSLQGPRGREVLNSAPQRTAEEILSRPNLRMPVSTVLPLKHINSQIAVNSMRPFFASHQGSSSMLSFGTAGSKSSLMITGMQDQVATAIRMVQNSDVPAEPQADAQPMKRAQGQAQRTTVSSNRLKRLEGRLADLEKRLDRLAKLLKKGN